MQEKFNDKLINILKKNEKFVDKEGNLIKSVIINSAIKIDKELIGLLIKDKEVKDTFFEKIEDLWIFNINKFVDYVQDKNVFSNSVTKFEAQIGLNIDNRFLGERGEVALVWPFKDCVLEGGMTKEDQDRDEIFFNEILAKDEIDRLEEPKVLTNFKKYTAKGEEKVKDFTRDENGTIKDNLIIKGNNLLALHSLKKEFAGKVKLIYIDPPYNTQSAANTFAYNNTFNHSSWLTFMKNRVEIAKELLSTEGIMVIAIDHSELFYLGVLLDEIFGRENRMGVISVIHNPGGRQNDRIFPVAHENMLFYAKDISLVNLNTMDRSQLKLEQFKQLDKHGSYKLRGFRRSGSSSLRKDRPNLYYPIYFNPHTRKFSLKKDSKEYLEILPIDEKGIERCWRWGSQTFLEKSEKYIEVKEISKNLFDLYVKEREDEYEGERAKTIWSKPEYTGQTATHELKLLFGENPFSYPKSPYLIYDIIKITTKPGDLVLDFFAGSGTTGAVAHMMERQYITSEQMDYIEKVTKERIKKIILKPEGGIAQKVNWRGGGEVIYCELMKYNEEAIDKIQDAKDTKTLLKIWEEMCDKYFLNYDVSIKKFNDNKKEFEGLSLKQQKKVLMTMLNKNQLYVNLSEIEDSQFKVSKEDKELNKKFYGGD